MVSPAECRSNLGKWQSEELTSKKDGQSGEATRPPLLGLPI